MLKYALDKNHSSVKFSVIFLKFHSVSSFKMLPYGKKCLTVVIFGTLVMALVAVRFCSVFFK